MQSTETVVRRCRLKKVFSKFSQNSQENTCARVSFSIKLQAEAYNFIKKVTLAQLFSCEFCEYFENTFFIDYLWLCQWDTITQGIVRSLPSVNETSQHSLLKENNSFRRISLGKKFSC